MSIGQEAIGGQRLGLAFADRLRSKSAPSFVDQPARNFCLPYPEGELNHELMAKRMRTLIVDDEPIARRVFIGELEVFPEVAIVGEAANGKQALLEIAKLQPDLVFLDIQMPVMSGFEVIQSLPHAPPPIVVIVTAFDEHALRAFDAGAIDYLLKPVQEARLRASVKRALRLNQRPPEAAQDLARLASTVAASSPRAPRKIVGRKDREYYVLDEDDVLAFQAEREFVTARSRLLATQSLLAIERRLEGSPFRRIHRNALVNVNHVRTIAALTSQRWTLTLSNSLQFTVSKRQAHGIRGLLNQQAWIA
jgi:DNA-binding LytR/AlgR family response regulator